jgi:hypothetical protein
MNIEQAKEAVTPFITNAAAKEYAAQTDQMLWVEVNIMDRAGVTASIEIEFDSINEAKG